MRNVRRAITITSFGITGLTLSCKGEEPSLEQLGSAASALSCRTTTLDATKTYNPSAWVDDSETLCCLSRSFTAGLSRSIVTPRA